MYGSSKSFKRVRDLLSPAKSSQVNKKSKSSTTPVKRLSFPTSRQGNLRTISSSDLIDQQENSASTSRISARSGSQLSVAEEINKQKKIDKSNIMSSFNEFKANMIGTIKDEEGAKAFRELMKPLITENAEQISKLVSIVKSQKAKIDYLETEVEFLKQQAVNKTMIITGVKVEENLSTLDIALKLFREKLGVSLQPADCDGIFRLANKKNDVDDAPPAIQLTLTTNRKKVEIMQNKKKLKDYAGERIYINEKLTQRQNATFAWARKMVKDKKLHAVWTREGKIFVKKKSDGRPELVTKIPAADDNGKPINRN